MKTMVQVTPLVCVDGKGLLAMQVSETQMVFPSDPFKVSILVDAAEILAPLDGGKNLAWWSKRLVNTLVFVHPNVETDLRVFTQAPIFKVNESDLDLNPEAPMVLIPCGMKADAAWFAVPHQQRIYEEYCKEINKLPEECWADTSTPDVRTPTKNT